MAPIVEVWAPGCTDEEIDARFAPLGIDLPEEARAWWRWHNGTSDDAPMQHRSIGGRTVFSLDVAAAAYRDERDDVRQVFGLEGLVPPVGDKPSVFFGCAGPRAEPVPIYVQNDIAEPRVVLPSIRSLLEAWLDLIDAGAWQLGSDGAWELDLYRVPHHFREAGLY